MILDELLELGEKQVQDSILGVHLLRAVTLLDSDIDAALDNVLLLLLNGLFGLKNGNRISIFRCGSCGGGLFGKGFILTVAGCDGFLGFRFLKSLTLALESGSLAIVLVGGVVEV